MHQSGYQSQSYPSVDQSRLPIELSQPEYRTAIRSDRSDSVSCVKRSFSLSREPLCRPHSSSGRLRPAYLSWTIFCMACQHLRRSFSGVQLGTRTDFTPARLRRPDHPIICAIWIHGLGRSSGVSYSHQGLSLQSTPPIYRIPCLKLRSRWVS